VEKDLLAAHQEKHIEELSFRQKGVKRESIPIFSMRV
jgi:hypothetical protein